MNGNSFFDAELLLHSECFTGSCMDLLEHPTGVVCSDRQESNVESFRIFVSDFVDEFPVSRITCKIKCFSVDFENETSPKCFVAVGDAPA